MTNEDSFLRMLERAFTIKLTIMHICGMVTLAVLLSAIIAPDTSIGALVAIGLKGAIWIDVGIIFFLVFRHYYHTTVTLKAVAALLFMFWFAAIVNATTNVSIGDISFGMCIFMSLFMSLFGVAGHLREGGHFVRRTAYAAENSEINNQ